MILEHLIRLFDGLHREELLGAPRRLWWPSESRPSIMSVMLGSCLYRRQHQPAWRSPSLQQVCLEEPQARQWYWPSALFRRRELTGTSCGEQWKQPKAGAGPDPRGARPAGGCLDSSVVASVRGVLQSQAVCLQEDFPKRLGGSPPLLCWASVIAVFVVIIWGQ